MNKKILMVDDSNSTIELVRTYIETDDDGYTIIGAKNGNEMWTVLDAIIPDLILLDIILPGEDGFQLSAKLNQDEKYKDIPLIFISSKNSGRDVKDGFQLDVYDYIKKPFDKFELEARITNTLKRKELEKQLEERSLKDSLTDCYNRKYFYSRINQQINYFNRTKTIFCVALIDIDNFKIINDTYGHLAGDHVLIQFTDMIKKNIRTYDILARYGGEEFVILYNNCAKSNANNSISHIRNVINESAPVFENNKIVFTFSCGIAEITEVAFNNKITFETIIKMADERLYKAKKLSKNTVVSD